MEAFKFIMSDFEVGISSNSDKFIIRSKDGITIYDDIAQLLDAIKFLITFIQNSNKK